MNYLLVEFQLYFSPKYDHPLRCVAASPPRRQGALHVHELGLQVESVCVELEWRSQHNADITGRVFTCAIPLVSK